MSQPKVGVLMGGLSTERDISLQSGQAVLKALQGRGHDAVAVIVDRDLPRSLVEQGIDVAWIALHGRFGEDGCVQGLLEVMGIPYTGSGVRASAVAMDKVATKRAVAHLDAVRLADDHIVRRGETWPADLPVPAVIKPAVGGSSIGVSVAPDVAARDGAIEAALELDGVVLVEAYVTGREITAAVLDGVALPIVAIDPVDGWFDLAAKYQKGRTVYTVPAPIPDEAAHQAQQAALAAYRAIGCTGLARADFILPPDGSPPVFLEINTLPGMTPTSLSPMAAGEVGIDFADLCEKILAGAHRMEAEVDLG